MQKKIVTVSVISMLAGILLGAGGIYWALSGSLLVEFTPPDVYLDAIPSTATYVIRNDGTYTYAINWNGKIDFHGDNAGMVINQAINASGTRKVFLKSAIYDIGTPIVAQSNLEIDAEPSTEIRRITDNNYLLKIESKTNVLVRNLIFDGANVTTSSPNEYYGLIYIKDSSRVTLDNLEVTGVGQTAAGRPTSGIHVTSSHDIRVYNCFIHDNQGSGIHVGERFDSPRNIYIQGNTVDNNTLQYVPGVFGAIVLANVQNSTVGFNRVRRATWGIECVGANFRWNTIIGNEILGSPDPTVVNEDGIEIFDEGATENRIIGNILAHWGENPSIMGTAIDVGQVYKNYTEDGVSRNVISGNTIKVAARGSVRGYGIYINGKCNVVTGNTIEQGTANELAIGISEGGVSDYNQIVNNDVSTILELSRRIQKIGPNSEVRYNSGFKTEASGLATVTGNVSEVWIEHGLVSTPRNGFPQVTALQGGQGDYWVSDKNATHFKIGFINMPEENSWEFNWYAET